MAAASSSERLTTAQALLANGGIPVLRPFPVMPVKAGIEELALPWTAGWQDRAAVLGPAFSGATRMRKWAQLSGSHR